VIFPKISKFSRKIVATEAIFRRFSPQNPSILTKNGRLCFFIKWQPMFLKKLLLKKPLNKKQGTTLAPADYGHTQA